MGITIILLDLCNKMAMRSHVGIMMGDANATPFRLLRHQFPFHNGNWLNEKRRINVEWICYETRRPHSTHTHISLHFRLMGRHTDRKQWNRFSAADGRRWMVQSIVREWFFFPTAHFSIISSFCLKSNAIRVFQLQCASAQRMVESKFHSWRMSYGSWPPPTIFAAQRPQRLSLMMMNFTGDETKQNTCSHYNVHCACI